MSHFLQSPDFYRFTCVSLQDANQALNSALVSGAAYFKEVWQSPESSDSRRKLLVDHDVIEKADGGYRFKVELVRRWIEKQI